ELPLEAAALAIGGHGRHLLEAVRHHEQHGRRRAHEQAHRHLLAAAGAALDLLLRDEVDPDHLSPGRRVARPTATASAGPHSSINPRSTLPSTRTRRNGSATSTVRSEEHTSELQ